jgi:hypothetical protein
MTRTERQIEQHRLGTFTIEVRDAMGWRGGSRGQRFASARWIATAGVSCLFG